MADLDLCSLSSMNTAIEWCLCCRELMQVDMLTSSYLRGLFFLLNNYMSPRNVCFQIDPSRDCRLPGYTRHAVTTVAILCFPVIVT